MGDPLHGFKGIVQIIGLGSGGVDADADQRILATGTQYVTVLRIEIGRIEPFFDVIFITWGISRFQCLPEGHQLQLLGGSFGNVHTQSSTGGNQQLF